MDPGPTLLDFDLDSVRHLRQRTGQTETISLTASYNFSFQEFMSGGPGTRSARTVLHETVHAYQMLATSYGHYYLSLRSMQTSRVLAILGLLREVGLAPKPPLIRQIMRGPRTRASSQLRAELYLWYLAEIVLLFFEGDTDRFGRQLLSHPEFSAGPGALFAHLERLILPWWQMGRHRVSAGPARQEDAEAAKDERNQFVMKMMAGSNFGDTLSVLESGARIAEYWRNWPRSLTEFDASFKPDFTPYTAWINRGLDWHIAPDPESFCLTYAALVDLALNGPLLPHHAALRGDGLMRDLNPIDRLMSGLTVTGLRPGDVPPIRDYQRDYEGFVTEICRRCRWPTPTALAQATLDGFPDDHLPVPRVTQLYGIAQVFRQEFPYAFIGLDIWQSQEQAAVLFKQSFVHPVIQFEDRILYHRDKSVLAEFVTGYAINQYLRQLMVTGNPPVEMPFRATPGDLEVYTEMVQDLMDQASPAAPRPQLVAAPAAAHRPGVTPPQP
jgi:hypothetical protein